MPTTGISFFAFDCFDKMLNSVQTTSYTLVSKLWASQNTFSTLKFMESLLHGICMMLVALGVNGIHGFLTSMMQMPLFL